MAAMQQGSSVECCRACAKAELLQAELAGAQESERRMLESLESQTRQLEQTMISLEEARLEIRYLDESARQNDACRLRAELDKALAAEAKSKKAMDDLAFALKEVTTKSNSAKRSHFESQAELAEARAEAERLRLEADESSAAWRDKESGFVDCIRILEEEVEHVRSESRRLVESQRSSRVEISKLRDIVKQAVNESNVVKEALEIARDENSQLKDALAEKENAYMVLKQDYECLRVSEAAAMDSIKELSGLLAAAASADAPPRPRSVSLFDGRERIGGDVRRVRPMMTKFPSESWRGTPWDASDDDGSSGRDEGSILDPFDVPLSPEGERVDSPSTLNNYKKKRQILRRFGDMLRMRSFHK